MSTDLILGLDGQTVIVIAGLVWAFCWYFVFRLSKARIGGGIPLAYLTIMSVIHSGALIYLLPWYDPREDAYLAQQGANLYETAIGFAISCLGVVGMTFGIWLSDRILVPTQVASRMGEVDPVRFARWLMGTWSGFLFL